MCSGVINKLSIRLRLLLFLVLITCLPGIVQSRQARPKAAAPVASAEGTAAADMQEVVAPDATQQANPPASTPAKKNVINAAKTAAAVAPKAGNAKSSNPAPAEPPLPIVPPPLPAETETPPAAETAAAAHDPVAEPPQKAELLAPAQGSGWAELIKTTGSVGLIICLILAGYFLFRRFAPQYMARRPGERDLRIVETLSMGEKRNIAIVQIGAQRLLLACTPGQITLLTALNVSSGTPAAASPDLLESPAAPVFTGNFKNLFEQERQAHPARPSAVKALSPDIRGKMLELRKALEG
jgi:flagellar biosynthetic protein FliO